MSESTKETTKPAEGVVIIKKYPNRRLYDTSTSRYVTQDELKELIKKDFDFQVVDAKTGEDLTRSVLTQIIFEMESKGLHLLPSNFLRQLIRFYDDSLGRVLAEYMQQAMEGFTQNQEKMRGLMGGLGTKGDFSPFKQFEELGRQNMEVFEKTFSMFTPFGMTGKTDKKDEKK